MRKLLLSAFLFLTSFCAFAQSKEAQIIALEKHWTLLLEKNDTVSLKKIWADNYVVNNAAGKIVSVNDILKIMRSGHVFPKVERNIEKITFNEDLAIVMGGEIEFGKNGEKKIRRFTNIWKSTPKGWRLIARQATGG